MSPFDAELQLHDRMYDIVHVSHVIILLMLPFFCGSGEVKYDLGVYDAFMAAFDACRWPL